MTQETKGEAPSDLITAVVNLVGTGPVPLGAYTPAEIAAVGGLISWLERDPGPESMAEAVRSGADHARGSNRRARNPLLFIAQDR